jgi:uncharacterized protein
MTVWIIAVFLFSAASARGVETLPPKPDRYFNDYAHVVDDSIALELNERLAQFERETSNQFLVAIYPHMESSSSVDDFTQRVAQSWGVGQKDRRNGVVLFVFVQDHQMFIQTGYGLEGALPDATCFDIVKNVIAPRFKENNYAAGLTNGIDAIIAATKGEYRGSGRTNAEGTSQPLPVGLIVFLVVLFLLFAISRARRQRRRGYWFSGMGGPYIGGWSGGSGGGGGSSGGGFSGFSSGGGSFGGGGAGGSW